MTNRKFGIEVEARASGDGFRKTEQQAKEANAALRKLERTLDQSDFDDYTRQVRRAGDTQEDYARLTKKVERSLEEAFRTQNRVADATMELARKTESGRRSAFEYATKYSKVITTLNQGRFHTVEMARALGILDKRTEQGGQSMHHFGTEAEGARLDLSSLENSLERLTLTVRELTTNLDKSEKRMNAGEIAVDALGTEMQDTGDRAYYLNQALFESEQNLHIWETRAEAAEAKARALGAEMKETGNDVDKVADELQQAGIHTDSFSDELDQLKKSVDRVDGKLGKLDRSLDQVDDGMRKSEFAAEAWAEVFGNVVSEVLEEAAQAAWEFSKESVKAFFDFDRKSREIFTLIPEASGEMRDALKADMLALGTELGRLPDEMLPAVYDALSAGIPESNVLSAVETASEAARAGVSDLQSTLKLGLAILNAQVGGVDNLDDVYDQLFFTVKNGVITMPELTDVMSQVTSIAGEAGVSMQDISSAMIVMTRQGDSASEAAELLSIMLTQLSTSGTTLASVFEEAAGKSFRTFITEGGNLAGAMEILQTHANNTGTALGDILGGGSPFFRDTQAARGALELTGKHLEDLIHFANEAEDATGSAGVASAEMGESAELSSLQAAAAVEELKVAYGEWLAEIGKPVVINATEFLKVWSGNQANKIQNSTDALVEGAAATGDYASAVARLSTAYETASTGTGQFLVDQDSRNALMDAGIDILKAIAAESANVEEFQQRIEELDISNWTSQSGEQLAVINDMTITVGEFYDEVQGSIALEEAAERTALYNEQLALLTERVMEAQAAQDLESLVDIDDHDARLDAIGAEIAAEQERVQAAQENKDVWLAANEEVTTSTRLRTVEIQSGAQMAAAALAAEAAAIEANNVAFNGYALSSLNGSEATTNWNDALFQSAGQMGINQEQFHLLAIASGEYSEAQIRAALTEAAMRQAVEELSGQLAAGKITVDDAVASLNDFEAALSGGFEATLDFSDFNDAEAQADKTKKALKAVEGNYTTTVTKNEVTNKTTNYQTNGTAPTPMHQGGKFGAHELLMVGDGPGGKFIPGVTEFVMFGKEGTVIGADESARLFAGQGLPPGYGNSPEPTSSPLINPSTEPAGNSPVTINVYLYEATNREITDSVLEALQAGGMVN